MKFSITVPASSSNIGPGFDTLGLAFKLRNRFDFEIADIPGMLEITGCDERFTSTDNLVYKSFAHTLKNHFKDASGRGLKLNISSQIPISRGLGSSASCIVAGVTAAFMAVSVIPDKNEIFNISAGLEGHPDNVSAAIFGGFTISVKDSRSGRYVCSRHTVPVNFKFYAVMPEFKISTDESRGKLPGEYSRDDAVYNISRASMTVAAYLTGDYALLKYSCDDRIHQPYRLPAIPDSSTIIGLCRSIGADVVFLSGSGPTLIAVLESDAAEFAKNADGGLRYFKNSWKTIVLTPDNNGLMIE